MIIFNIYITTLIEGAHWQLPLKWPAHYQLLVGEFPCRAFEQANGQDLPVRIYGLHNHHGIQCIAAWIFSAHWFWGNDVCQVSKNRPRNIDNSFLSGQWRDWGFGGIPLHTGFRRRLLSFSLMSFLFWEHSELQVCHGLSYPLGQREAPRWQKT